MKTIFCDIDGTIFRHVNPTTSTQTGHRPDLLPGTVEKLVEWDKKGYKIILVTGRRESCRRITEEQLSDNGIIYDYLLMGIGPGERILINDLKKDSDKPTALAFNLKRDRGIDDIKI